MPIRLVNIPAKLKSEEIKDALNFFAETLMSKRMCNGISIKVCFGEKQENTTVWEDDNYRPREFTITVNSKVGYRSMLLTLAHEMVHVKQYATGELRDSLRGPTLNRWMNKPYDSNVTDYWDQPWEIEAYGREYGLYLRFRERRKKNAQA
jgi:hypothetical protein